MRHPTGRWESKELSSGLIPRDFAVPQVRQVSDPGSSSKSNGLAQPSSFGCHVRNRRCLGPNAPVMTYSAYACEMSVHSCIHFCKMLYYDSHWYPAFYPIDIDVQNDYSLIIDPSRLDDQPRIGHGPGFTTTPNIPWIGNWFTTISMSVKNTYGSYFSVIPGISIGRFSILWMKASPFAG